MTEPAPEQSPPSPGRLTRLSSLARLGNGGAGRHVAQLGGGTAVVMAIQLGAQVLLGHWYSDAEFATFRNLVAFATIVAMVATLRLEMTIPLAEEESGADDITRLVVVLATGASLICLPVAVVLAVGGWAVPEEYRLSVLIAPFVVWASACFTALRAYQSRKGQFRQMSDANIAGTVFTAGTQVGFGGVGFTSTGLGLGYGLGRLAAVFMMIRRSTLALKGRVDFGLIRTWKQFPTWMLLPAVLNAITVGAVSPLVTMLYGPKFAGQFGFAQMLLAVPVAMLGQAVASVFYVRFAAMQRDSQDTSQAMIRLATVLMGIALMIFVPITLLGREAFNLIWADGKWETAGFICGIMAPYLMVNFVSSPLSGYAAVKNEVRRQFLLSWIEAGLRIPALALGLWWGGPYMGILAYSVAGLLICLYWVLWVTTLSGAGLARGWGAVAIPLVVALMSSIWSFEGRVLVDQMAYVGVSLAVSVVAAGIGGLSVLKALRA
ncbi:Polysaccharide biosynthesis protein [Austwickia chelonae]|uniref:Polysaccharide biosynthesis protein n=1 Tax=Austwickia chelonae NBRC 105200 TaxID=1184607 RepID=K6VN53_9MICO|nr:oligosaccharide flippase family protein [Austwickia chelonae]GAB78149.1 hypothetical protein AUCHE_08_03940 [Austwickia chelonae NBRC 105200]SEV97664.1 Polysaccharide biosynthesis protein [Austwickia chelonae]